MKVTKTFTLDLEIIEKLKQEDNASELVNNLLTNYFNISDNKELSLEEKLKEVEELENAVIQEQEIKRKKLEEDIQQLKQKEKEMKELQLKKIQENVELIETEKELANKFLNYISNDESKLTSEEVLDWVTKFRDKGLKIGLIQLKQYYRFKKHSG